MAGYSQLGGGLSVQDKGKVNEVNPLLSTTEVFAAFMLEEISC